MKRHFRWSLTFGLIIQAAASSACGDGAPPEDAQPVSTLAQPRASARLLRSGNRVPDQYIVVLKDAEPGGARSAGAAVRALESRHAMKVERTFEHALRGFVVRGGEERARALAEDPDVKYVVEDSYVQGTTTQTGATWGLDRIDQRGPSLDSSYNYTPTGSGVHAYVLDSGIRSTHSEFGGRASLDFTAISDGYGASDCHGHGTHVAGTLGGNTHGVAKGVRLHSVRVLDCNNAGTVSGAISGVDWVTAHHIKPAVANMSLGAPANQALDDAINNSINAGITYVVAAGNHNTDACNTSPARVLNAVTVGASTSGDSRASYSNYGSCLDLFAPGSDILSAYKDHDGSFAWMNGTSMASPHVAGAAALHLQLNPSALPKAVAGALLDSATSDVPTGDIGAHSPQRLLFTRWISSSSRVISLRTGASSYFRAEGGGGGMVSATASGIGPSERFNLVDANGGALTSGDTVYLQSYKGNYLAAEWAGGSFVKATAWGNGPWETFRIWKVGGSGTITSSDSIALQASSGHYFVAEGNGWGEVNANRTAIGPWETFTLLGTPKPFEELAWQLSGPGTLTSTADPGSADAMSFSYFLNGSSVWSTQTWTFSAIAPDTRVMNLNWKYSGFHAFYMVHARARAFADGPNGRVYVDMYLRDAGDGWNVEGVTGLVTSAGYPFGIVIEGRNYDGDARLLGTMRISPRP